MRSGRSSSARFRRSFVLPSRAKPAGTRSTVSGASVEEAQDREGSSAAELKLREARGRGPDAQDQHAVIESPPRPERDPGETGGQQPQRDDAQNVQERQPTQPQDREGEPDRGGGGRSGGQRDEESRDDLHRPNPGIDLVEVGQIEHQEGHGRDGGRLRPQRSIGIPVPELLGGRHREGDHREV